jgi:hypothetical protein
MGPEATRASMLTIALSIRRPVRMRIVRPGGTGYPAAVLTAVAVGLTSQRSPMRTVGTVSVPLE